LYSKNIKKLAKPMKNKTLAAFGIDGDKAGNDWQDKIEARFKKLNLNVELLDRKGKGSKKSCIDFYVHRKSAYQDGFLCEAKSVNVVGFDEEEKTQISSRNNEFWNSVGKRIREHSYNNDNVESKVREGLIKAVNQYENSDLNGFKIVKEGKPFVVSIGFDFTAFSDQVNFSQLLIKFPLVSAVLILDSMQDCAEFKVCQNTSAQIHFQESFLQ